MLLRTEYGEHLVNLFAFTAQYHPNLLLQLVPAFIDFIPRGPGVRARRKEAVETVFTLLLKAMGKTEDAHQLTHLLVEHRVGYQEAVAFGTAKEPTL